MRVFLQAFLWYNPSMTINDFFEEHNKIAIAYSGGTDSVYLLYAAHQAGADVRAYYVRSQFQPEFEFSDAKEMAARIFGKNTDRLPLSIIELDALADNRVSSNPQDRCYYCKLNIMGTIMEAARSDGYTLLCDGTNASDDVNDRPGMKALAELGVVSPLRMCGLTKSEIRKRLKDAGIPVWNKPAYACLATRIASGELITADKLRRTETAEGILYDMGFRDFRVRMRGDSALVQVKADQYRKALDCSVEIVRNLGNLYKSVAIDSNTR